MIDPAVSIAGPVEHAHIADLMFFFFSESSVSNAILCCLLYLLTFLVGVCSHFIVLTLIILRRYEVNKLISVMHANLVSLVLQYNKCTEASAPLVLSLHVVPCHKPIQYSP